MNRPKPGRSPEFLFVALMLVVAWIFFGPHLVKAVRGEESDSPTIVFVGNDQEFEAVTSQTVLLKNLAIKMSYYESLSPDKQQLLRAVALTLFDTVHQPLYVYSDVDVQASGYALFESLGIGVRMYGCGTPVFILGVTSKQDMYAAQCIWDPEEEHPSDEYLRRTVQGDYVNFLQMVALP